MRTGLTALQTNILDANVKKEISWLFEVDQSDNGSVDYYWSTKEKAYGGQTYSDIDGGENFVLSFSSINMRRNASDAGIIFPDSMEIVVNNPGSSLVPSDFVGAYIKVRLIMKAELAPQFSSDLTSSDLTEDATNEEETEIASWGFEVKDAWTTYQVLHLSCVDWLQEYLNGDYPKTPLVSTLWPAANIPDDNYCVPKIWGTPYFPIRWTKTSETGGDCYVLGEYASGETHTITSIKPPTEKKQAGEFLESDTNHTFTITEDTTADDGNDYATATFVIEAGGSNIFWDRINHPDVPCKYSNSATVSVTNPIQIIKEILEDMGVPSDKIDTTSYNSAKDTWTTRGLTWDVALFYKEDRRALLARLLTMCNTSILCRDVLHFKVNDPTSQHTINNSWVLKGGDIGQGSFTYRTVKIENNKDSGHCVYRPSDKSIDDNIKLLVAAKSTTNDISDTTVDCLFISDSQEAQKIAKLALQRLLLIEGQVDTMLKSKCLQLEVGDMVTIEGANYNAISNYDVLIDSMSIARDGSVRVSGTKFSAALDDWGDLSPGAIVIIEDDTSGGFYSVVSGPETPGEESGLNLNEMFGVLRIGAGSAHIVLDASSKYISIGDSPPSGYGNNVGIWLGLDSGTPKMSLYKDSNNFMQFDGTTLTVTAAVTPSGGDAFNKNTDDLDDITDGSTYAKLLASHISAGVVKISSEDSIAEGSLSGASRVILSTSGISCYNSSSDKTVEIKTDGDVTIGDYANNKGIFYDNSEGSLFLKTNENGKFQILGGGDITLTGSDTDPGIILFDGTSYDTRMAITADGSKFGLIPSTDGQVDCYIGSNAAVWGSEKGLFSHIKIYASTSSELYGDNSATVWSYTDADNNATLLVSGASSYVSIRVDNGTDVLYKFAPDAFAPWGHDNEIDLGKAADAWQDIYYYTLNDVGDYFFMDNMKIDGKIREIKDLDIIENIKPSGEYDSRTGFALIDDNSVPEFLYSKDKKTGETLRNPDGKPYFMPKAWICILMGAIKELNRKIERLETRGA